MWPQLRHVIKADHVVGESNHSLFGEVDAASGDAAVICVSQAAIRPVTAGIENGRERAIAFAARPIQIAS